MSASHPYNTRSKTAAARAKAHFNYGVLLKKKGNIAGAEHHYQEALRINPNYAKAHINLAYHLWCKDDAGAERHYQEAIRIDPKNAEAHYNYALLARVHLKDMGKARKLYQKGWKLAPNNPNYPKYAHLYGFCPTGEFLYNDKGTLAYAWACYNYGRLLLKKKGVEL